MAVVVADEVNWNMLAAVIEHPTRYFPLTAAQIRALAAAPIPRCACPLPAHLQCAPGRCDACHDAMQAVITWGVGAVCDDDGRHLRQPYLLQALLGNAEYWNEVRRGLLAPLPPPPPQSALTCAICLEDVHEGARFLRCMHGFHRACIRQWLRRRPACPTCRVPA